MVFAQNRFFEVHQKNESRAMILADIRKIIEAGCRAPSGDNSQPWRFEVKGEVVDIYNLSEKDNPILNYGQSGSYIAHGGLVENMIIAGKHFGYRAEIKLFPNAGKPDITARVVFTKTEPEAQKLFEAIYKRATNRKSYESTLLTAEEKESLVKIPMELGLGSWGEIQLIEDGSLKQKIGKASASIEKVILEDEKLHGYLFRDVRWSKKEELKEKSGLYIETMEFKPPQKIAFRLASWWPFMRIGILLGLPKLIVNDDSKLYATGAALGIIRMNGDAPVDFINAGRIFERLWLTATGKGLYLQPVTALLFAARRLFGGDDESFNAEHAELIKREYENLKNVFGVKDGVIAMHFRLGHAAPPSANSSRKDPDIIEG
jgi:nitroreductase